MYKNLLSKRASVIIAIAIGVLAGCRNATSPSSDSDFLSFEKELANRLSSGKKNIVTLIGFKTIPVNDSEKEQYKTLMSEQKDELKKSNTVFSTDFSFYRIYFPLHTVIVEYNGKTYTADEKGVVSIPNMKDINKIKVIGRKKSETVRGTGSNIIEEDRILLKEPFELGYKNNVETGHVIDNNICVFDLGVLAGMF